MAHCGLHHPLQQQWYHIQSKYFHFAENEVEFMGFRITMDGIKKHHENDHPTVSSTYKHQWYQILVCAGKLAVCVLRSRDNAHFPGISTNKKKQKFYWDNTHDHLFENS